MPARLKTRTGKPFLYGKLHDTISCKAKCASAFIDPYGELVAVDATSKRRQDCRTVGNDCALIVGLHLELWASPWLNDHLERRIVREKLQGVVRHHRTPIRISIVS